VFFCADERGKRKDERGEMKDEREVALGGEREEWRNKKI
jgi:hypothetical protein